jgi:hypothetical protein
MTTALCSGLNRNQDPHFTAHTAATFAGLSLAPNRGVIEFNHTPERIPGIPILHGLKDFMTPAPGRWIGDAQIILELTGRGARGSGGHQKDRPEPVSQWCPCLVKDGIGSEGSLLITLVALVLSPRCDEPGVLVAAAGTAEAIGPLALDEISNTIALVRNRRLNCFGVIDVYMVYLYCIRSNGPLIIQQKYYNNQVLK